MRLIFLMNILMSKIKLHVEAFPVTVAVRLLHADPKQQNSLVVCYCFAHGRLIALISTCTYLLPLKSLVRPRALSNKATADGAPRQFRMVMGFRTSVVLFLTAVLSVSSGDSNSTLYLLVLAPFPPNESDPDGLPAPQYRDGPALVPAVKLAVEHINNQSDILADYSLDYVLGQSGCQAIEQTVISFTRHIFHSENVHRFVGIIGPACSESALIVAGLALESRRDIVQIAPTAVAPLLDNSTFTNTFRGLGSARVYADIALALMDDQRWTRVGALYEATRKFFSSIFNDFEEKIPEQQLVYSNGLDGEGREVRLSEILDQRLRIIFVFAGRSLSRKLLCLAYKEDLVYPTYQWIFHHRELSNFWESTSFMGWNCSLDDMKKATEGIILSLYSPARRDDMITVANRTYDQYREQYVKYREEYVKELNAYGSNINISDLEPEVEYSNVYYDSVWALALSLNSSLPFLKEGTSNTQGELATSVIRQNLLEVDFEGMSGTIRFNSTTRASETSINDVFLIVPSNNSSGGPQKDLIGFYDPMVSNITEFQNHAGLISDKFDERLNHAGLGIGIFLLLVAIAMFLLVFILHVVNFIFCNEKSLKASSPSLNHLIFSGCYLLSVAIIFVLVAEIFVPSIHEQNIKRTVKVFYGVQCSVADWCYALAYSLIIGAVCAKQWRIYQIFSHFRQGLQRSITDSSMIGLICVVVLLDVIYSVVWSVVDPWTVELSDTFSVNVIDIKLTCRSEHTLTRLLVAGSVKGLLAVLAIFLATLNRHVHLKVYNETKAINILAYALILVNTVGGCMYALLPRESIWFFLIYVIVAFLDVFLCMFLLFVLPIAPLIKRKFFQR